MDSPAETAVGTGNDVLAADYVRKANNAIGNKLRMLQHEATTDLFVAELVRHFPGLAPALTRVWRHVSGAFFETVGTCCTPPDPENTDAAD